MRTIALLPLPLVIALAAPAGAAWRQVEQSRPASADGVVEIEIPSGRVVVVGWDQNEVRVTGEVDDDAELELDGTGSHIQIGVDSRNGHGQSEARIEVRVPRGSRVEIDASPNASVEVQGVDGRIRAEAVNGGITVEGGSSEIEVETVNGGVEIDAPASRVRAESVNGRVVIEGASGDIEASTVNGRLEVSGGRFERARLEIVNGRVIFAGDLSRTALLEVESVSGDVELILAGDVAADFQVSSFSGEIDNDFGARAERTSRWTTEKELRFSNGGGGASVEIHTLSGDVQLRKRQ
jgi:DUF4097 and DUF4098 domain-containing protein YvlB